MKVEYRVTEDDYAEAMQFHEWRRAGRPSAITTAIILIPLILVILAVWRLPPDAAYIITIYVVTVSPAVVAAVRVYIGVLNGARRMCRQCKAIEEPMTVELSDEGLRLGSALGEAITLWRMIFQWRQNDQFLLIYNVPRVFDVVPKSVAQQRFGIPLLLQRLAKRVGQGGKVDVPVCQTRRCEHSDQQRALAAARELFVCASKMLKVMFDALSTEVAPA